MDNLLIQLGVIAAATISGVAAIFAARAEKNSRPVANGFAEEVLHDLRELRKLVFQHLKEHDKRGQNVKECIHCTDEGTATKRRKTVKSLE